MRRKTQGSGVSLGNTRFVLEGQDRAVAIRGVTPEEAASYRSARVIGRD